MRRSNEYEAPRPCLFCCGEFKCFDIANFVSSVKIAFAAHKIVYLDTYNIFFHALSYVCSVNCYNQDSERTGKIASSVLKLYSSYTGPSLLAEFRKMKLNRLNSASPPEYFHADIYLCKHEIQYGIEIICI